MDGDLEQDLVNKARRGDPSAAPFLVSCYGERLLGYARAHARDLSDADRENIVELAIEAGVRAIDRFDPNKGSLEGWFRGQVRFQTLAHRRRVPATTATDSDLAQLSVDAPTDPARTSALQRALGRLKPDEQRILALRSTEQIAFEEIAQRLDISTDAARQRHHRALGHLRTEAMKEPEFENLLKEADN